MTYIARSRRYRGIGWGEGPSGPDAATIWAMLKLGVPMAATVVLEVSLFSLAAIAIGRFGPVPVAAHQIALNVAGLSFMVPLGLSAAITVRVGNAVGRGDPEGTRRAGLVGIGLAIAIQCAAAVVFLGFPWTIATLYSSDQAVQAATVQLLWIAGLFQLSDGAQVAANGALRGIKDTRVPVIITLVAYWGIGMPLGLTLAFTLEMGARGMWFGLLAGLTTASVILLWRFLHRSLVAAQHGVKLVA